MIKNGDLVEAHQVRAEIRGYGLVFQQFFFWPSGIMLITYGKKSAMLLTLSVLVADSCTTGKNTTMYSTLISRTECHL